VRLCRRKAHDLERLRWPSIGRQALRTDQADMLSPQAPVALT
jgi:hypothetical protein